MFYDALKKNRGKCPICGGELYQASTQINPTWCQTCDSIYIWLNQLYKNLSGEIKEKVEIEIQLSNITDIIRAEVLNDKYHDVNKKPEQTGTK